MSWKFSSAAELLERAAAWKAAGGAGSAAGATAGGAAARADAGAPAGAPGAPAAASAEVAPSDLAAWLLARESAHTGRPEAELREEVARRIRITRQAVDRGIREPQRSRSGLTEGAAAKAAASEAWPVEDDLFRRALTYALAANEVNACGGKVVAFPTAGSSGIVPGVLWAYRDAREPSLGPDSPRFQDAFVLASAVGMVIAAKATLAGAAGGCQAECGAAAAMAAAGLAFLHGEPTAVVFDAAALSLKNSLGLACDPVAGLVEVPCVKRNAFSAGNALVAVSLARAGIRSAIPFDEVVDAMRAIGDAMPAAVRESAEGGLARTQTGIEVARRIGALPGGPGAEGSGTR